MTAERGRRLARRALTVLRRTYGTQTASVRRPALEELLLGILVKGGSERAANTAFNNLMRAFVDWNEVRVSSASEIAAEIASVPQAMEKAVVIRQVLQKIYDATSELSLDFLRDKSAREAARMFADIAAFPEGALARATVLVLGHPVLPLTPRVMSVCKRIGLLGDSSDYAALSRDIERFVPRDKMFEFHWLISRHAEEVCRIEEPACDKCGLRTDCRSAKVGVNAYGAPASAARRPAKVGKAPRR